MCTIQSLTARCSRSSSHSFIHSRLSLHSTGITTHFTRHTAHFILHNLYCTLYTAHYILHNLHCTLISLHTFTRYIPLNTNSTPQFTLHSFHYTLHTALYTIYLINSTPIYCKLRIACCIMHTNQFTEKEMICKRKDLIISRPVKARRCFTSTIVSN